MAAGRRKIAVIGAGNVGATCAFVLAQMKVADIVLLDIFEGFAKGVMAKYYRSATEDQRVKFAEKFKMSLARTYSKALLEFDSDSVTIKSSEIEKTNRAKVLVEVKSSSGSTYPIIYSLRLIEERWYLRNLVVNGINLGLQFRSQFNSSYRLHRGDLDRVIKEWKVSDEDS